MKIIEFLEQANCIIEKSVPLTILTSTITGYFLFSIFFLPFAICLSANIREDFSNLFGIWSHGRILYFPEFLGGLGTLLFFWPIVLYMHEKGKI